MKMTRTGGIGMKLLSAFLISIAMSAVSSAAYADWQLPISVTGGGTTAMATIGVDKGASEGYDPGRDVPVLEPGVITAYFAHPEWGVVQAGDSFSNFYQEIKGETYPAVWEMTVESPSGGTHTVSWELPDKLPRGLELSLNPPGGGEVDMIKNSSYSYTPSAVKTFRIEADISLNPVPYAPDITTMKPKNKGLFITWTDDDPDAVGYKIHFGKESGNYYRTIDVKKVTNLRLNKLTNGTTYYVAVSAYNDQAVDSGYSEEVRGIPANNRPTSPVASFQKFETGTEVLLEIGTSSDDDGEMLSYSVEVYGDRNLENLVASTVTLTGGTDRTTWNAGILSDGVYFWRVSASDGTDSGNWSSTRAFRVGSASDARSDKALGGKRF